MSITYQTYEYGSHDRKSKQALMNERQLDLTQQIIYLLHHTISQQPLTI